MKITKRQLKRIIKEEKVKLLREASNFRDPKTGENLWLMLNDVIEKLLDGGVDTTEMASELHGLADDVEANGPAPSGTRGDIMTREDR